MSAIAVAAHGRTIVCSLIDGALEMWDLEQARRLRRLTGHQGCMSSGAFLPDDRSVVSASHDGTVRVWDTETGVCERTIAAHVDWIRGMALTPDAAHAVTASSDGAVGVWDVLTGQIVARLNFDSSPQSTAVAPDGVTIVVGDNYGRVYFLRLEGAVRSNPPAYSLKRAEGPGRGKMAIYVEWKPTARDAATTRFRGDKIPRAITCTARQLPSQTITAPRLCT